MKLNSAQSIHSAILMGLLLFTSTGCGSGNSPTTSSTTTQPTTPAAPAVPAGWVNIDRPYFNFSYPSGWQLTEGTSTVKPYVLVTEPGSQHFFFVQFELGVVNQPDILSQCAGAYKYMTDFYNATILPLATSPGTTPYTTTTYEPNYGFIGGKGMFISVVTTRGSGPTFNLWLDAIPRADGIYLVGYRDPGDSYDVWVAARKKFTDTIVFNKSQALPSTAYCSS